MFAPSNNSFLIAGHKEQQKNEFEGLFIDHLLAIIYSKMHFYTIYHIGERNMNLKYVNVEQIKPIFQYIM